MRLHHITITAFGPFAGTERVDFDALSDAGLFLINGPTGAGKTSVLDAVCFALYGRVPSARNDAKNLRSQHAPPDRTPEVVLEASIRGRRFSVTRSPRWDRPKKRGEGTTEEKARVVLRERRDGEWTTWSTRFDEAGQQIGDLLGMSAEQFCQVVLLPQGDFAAFLRAGAEDRRAVLERLFATEVYAQVERWFFDRRRDTAREADALRATAESVGDRAAEAARVDRPDLDPDALAGWATELSGHFADICAQTALEAVAATAARDAARAAAERARSVAARQERHADARRRADTLAGRSAERAGLAATLRAAERADRVLPLLRRVYTCSARHEDATAVVARHRDALTRLVPDTADADLMRKEERARRDQMVELGQRGGDALRLEEIDGLLAQAALEADRLADREAELALFLKESPAFREIRRAELEQARARAAALPMAAATADALSGRLEAARLRDGLAASLAAAEADHRTAVDEAQAARDAALEIRQARLDGMAAWLAGHLEAGAPCRVCGSLEHPEPAITGAEHPVEDAEADADAAYEQARLRREDTGNRVARLSAELEAAAERCGDAGEAELRASLETAREELAGLAGADADIERIEDELTRVEADYEDARDSQGEVASALTEIRTHRTALTGEADRLRAAIDAARGEDPTLEARVARLDGEAGLLGGAVTALEELRIAAQDLGNALTEATSAAEAQGFDDVEAVRSAALDDDARTEVARLRKADDDEEARLAELLGDPELTSAAALPPPDTASLEAALAVAEDACQAVGSARDRSEHRRDRLTALAAELRAHTDGWRPAHDHHRLVADVAALTSGDPGANRLRMRLSAYVLAARLEQVVAAANERLARMSSARYALEHTVDRAAGERGRHGTGGLGLRVIDGWTGRHREPATLSGGETFITSLALALGLADVVTTEAGGAEIGTLFVDEGFGTLDEDTLDEVMEVLDGLRDGGRAVGIVSHVAELRTRIPAQLKVRKTRTGSALEVTGAA